MTKEEKRERQREAARRYRLTEKGKINTSKTIERTKKRDKFLREIALQIYGPVCVCCGETEHQFLTFDHKDNGYGNPAKRPTLIIQRWLKNNNYPDTIQVLCYNCNCSKGFYGKCPHQS